MPRLAASVVQDGLSMPHEGSCYSNAVCQEADTQETIRLSAWFSACSGSFSYQNRCHRMPARSTRGGRCDARPIAAGVNCTAAPTRTLSAASQTAFPSP